MRQIEKIQEQLKEQGLDGLLLTDEKNQRYAAGFAFTDGAVLVGREKAWLITDSRYIEAAEKTAAAGVQVRLYDRERPLLARLKEAIQEAGMERLAAEDSKLSHREYLAWEKALGRPLLPAGELMARLRAAKTEEEIDAMRADFFLRRNRRHAGRPGYRRAGAGGSAGADPAGHDGKAGNGGAGIPHAAPWLRGQCL